MALQTARRPALHIVDADRIAAVAAEIVRPNQGTSKNNRLAKALRDEWAPLNPFQEWKEDYARTADIDLAEVARAARVEEIFGATVHGSGEDAVVIFSTTSPQGRVTNGILPYSLLERSRRAYEERVEAEVEAAKAARARGGSEDAFGEDPRVAVLTRELQRAKEALADASRPDAPVEPVAGYGQMLSSEVVEVIDATPDPVDREVLKRRVREYELGMASPRAAVLAATEPTVLAPVDPPTAA